MINEEDIPIRKETRIGDTVIKNSSRIKFLINTVLDSLSEQSTCISILPRDFQSIGSAFGSLFKEELIILTFPNKMNYQTYCVSDPYFQGYNSLTLDITNDIWFLNITKEENTDDILVLCRVMIVKLFHLFEE